MKKVAIRFIDDGYLDGSCIKDELGFFGTAGLHIKLYCLEDCILIYAYSDNNCTKDFR